MIEELVGLWQPAITSEQATSAMAVAREVSGLMRGPAAIEEAAAAAVRQTAFPLGVHWQPYSVAQGHAGLAVMCGYLDRVFPGEGWDGAGHTYLALAARDMESLGYYPPSSLWSGMSGLAFAAWYLSGGGVRYRRMLATLEGALLPRVHEQARAVFSQRYGVSVGQFDVISGLSGIGAYLLCRRDDDGAAAALDATMAALVHLSGEEAGVPRWHTPFGQLWDDGLRRDYPYGNLNCGLAHGIPGPLAFLALARLNGVQAPGLDEAIDRLASWVAGNRCDDQWGVNWPNAVPLELTPDARSLRPAASEKAPYGPSRSAWCYGPPGIARALWLAGQALDTGRYRDLAVAAMEAVYRRPLAARQIDSPTLCHGVAGLALVTLRFARDTGLPVFREAAQSLVAQLLEQRDAEARLGYFSLEPGGTRVDQPGILDGAPGVPMVLLAAASAVTPDWDRLFVLA